MHTGYYPRGMRTVALIDGGSVLACEGVDFTREDSWRVVTPEEVGLDSAPLAELAAVARRYKEEARERRRNRSLSSV